MSRQPRSGGRQTTDFAFRPAIGDPNANSAQRNAQIAFASQRSGGIQLASKSITLNAAFGDTIAIENTSAATADMPVIKLPRIGQGDTGKTIMVVPALQSQTANFTSNFVDPLNGAAAGSATHTLDATHVMAVFYAVAPKYGWRCYRMAP